MNQRYGLPENQRYGGPILRKHLEKYIGFKCFISKASLLFRIIRENSIRVCSSFVNETISSVNGVNCKISNETEWNFKRKPTKFGNMQLAGLTNQDY